MPLQVELVSPEKIVFEGEADLVIVRTTDGEVGFQAGHVPFVGVLAVGEVRAQMTNGSIQHIAVHRGFVEIADNHVTILSDVAELASEIDVPRAQTALANAEAAFGADSSDAEAAGALSRATVRLRVAENA